MACHTQWSVGGLGQRTGLRYEGCIALLERYLPRWCGECPDVMDGVEMTDLLADLQIVESAILGHDAERAERERAEASR
jgi:hypothetical protein